MGINPNNYWPFAGYLSTSPFAGYLVDQATDGETEASIQAPKKPVDWTSIFKNNDFASNPQQRASMQDQLFSPTTHGTAKGQGSSSQGTTGKQKNSLLGDSSGHSISTPSGSSRVEGTTMQELAGKVSQRELDVVKGKDLNERTANGTPKYLIAKGLQDNKYHIYQYSGKENWGKGSEHAYDCVDKKGVQWGNRRLYVNSNKMNQIKESLKQGTSGKDAPALPNENNSPALPGENKAPAIPGGKGAPSIPDGNNAPVIPVIHGDYESGSPLILDTNHDGKVGAKQGTGVDINGDGKADGAATNGDKMLAMAGTDGSGKIDGTKVFGDHTVDPFTGKAVCAKNGFEALQKVAESAQKNTQLKDIIGKNGDVDLQKLNQAMQSSKVGSLGLISDNNTSRLEGLGDAKSINVNDYKEQKENGDVQHNQQGSYTDTKGEKHKTDDVWFKYNKDSNNNSKENKPS